MRALLCISGLILLGGYASFLSVAEEWHQIIQVAMYTLRPTACLP